MFDSSHERKSRIAAGYPTESVGYPTTFDPDAHIELRPHYTDQRFKEEQTVFGEADNTLDYVYSDRLVQWDYEKSKRAWKTAKEADVQPDTARFIEAYLSAYFDEPVQVRHIISGVNRSNGYPYNAFGFRKLSDSKDTPQPE